MEEYKKVLIIINRIEEMIEEFKKIEHRKKYMEFVQEHRHRCDCNNGIGKASLVDDGHYQRDVSQNLIFENNDEFSNTQSHRQCKEPTNLDEESEVLDIPDSFEEDELPPPSFESRFSEMDKKIIKWKQELKKKNDIFKEIIQDFY